MPILPNEKHELFAQAVAKGGDLEQAYEDAGYKRSLKNAHRLRNHEVISRRIEELLSQAAVNVGISIERTLEETARIAFADLTDAVEWRKGRLYLKDSAAIPAHVRAAISEIKQGQWGLTIKFHSKTTALDMLHKHLGSYKPQQQEVRFSFLDLVRRSFEVPAAPLGPPPKVIEHES